MHPRRPRLSSLLVLTTVLCGCDTSVRGNGRVVERAFALGGFCGVRVEGAVQLAITRADADEGVRVRLDENLFEHLEVRVRGGDLVIAPAEGYVLEPTTLEASVSTRCLSRIEASGASEVVANALVANGSGSIEASGASTITVRSTDADDLRLELSGASEALLEGVSTLAIDVDASGASRVRLAGATDDLSLELSGASRADASGLTAETVAIEASGASEARIVASASVDGELSGASSLACSSALPVTVQVDVSGGSTIDCR